jgi:phage-related minor tail protein
MGQKVTTASDRSAESMKKWNEAGRALGLGLASIGLVSSKIAGDAEASTARMTTAFENVGLSVDDFHDKIDDLTGTGLKLAFDDEDVQDSLARLIATTGNAEKAFRDVGIAEDLARSQGISLASATDMVNAAEAGRFRGLQQLGIQLRRQRHQSEEAIAALQGRVAGQAQAYPKPPPPVTSG